MSTTTPVSTTTATAATASTATMLAYVVEKTGSSSCIGQVKRIPRPTPAPGQALIRVLRAGVCNTDLEILKGYMGFTGVLGHEFVGVVEQVVANNDDDQASAAAAWIGQRVCGDINVGCQAWTCAVCQNADNLDASCPQYSRNHCPNRTVLGILNKDGTMAEYLTLPLSNLHKVPPELSDEEAVFAEPLAAACRIPEQNLIQTPTDRVAILGDGKLGLMIAEVMGRLNLHQRPMLFGKHPHKMDLVRDSAGVDCRHVSECQADESDTASIAAEHCHRYDVVVDATGSPAGLTLAIGLCRPMGTICLKSTCAGAEPLHAAPLVIDELRVVGSRCGPIEQALTMMRTNHPNSSSSGSHIPTAKAATTTALCVTKYITKCFPLSQAQDAIQCAAEKATMKVQIVCSPTD
jgi:threonine dehydrogenase-like Zn-dependent dehydrogenase